MSRFSTPRWWYAETGGSWILRALFTPASWVWGGGDSPADRACDPG